MKTLLGVLLTVVSFNSAMATSIMGTLLHYDRTAKVLNANPNHSLDVYVNGQVVHRVASPQLPNGGGYKVVGRLSAHQVDRIERLIRRARPVKPGFEASRAFCFAPSMFTDTYNADNYSLPLRKGAMCDGGFQINDKPAAKKLVAVLNALENAAHKGLSVVELDSQVEAALE